MAKIVDPDSLNIGTELVLDTSAKTISLVATGNLVAKDGVTLQALYSKLILLWETSTYNKYPFPMYVIDAKSGQYQFGTDGGSNNGWKPLNDTTRTYLRDGGWSEYSSSGVLNRQYVGVVSLGDVSNGAQLYYQKVSGGSASNFTFTDECNEGIQVYGDASNGNFDSRAYFKGYVREGGYKYKDSTLADTGQTGTGAYTINVLLSNEADLDIKNVDAYITKSVAITGATWVGGVATFTATGHAITTGDIVVISGVTSSVTNGYNRHGVLTSIDANTFSMPISVNPGTYTSGGTVKLMYDKIGVRYFSSAYSKDIDTVASPRNFGIVIESGTHSGIDGSVTGSTLTSAAGGIDADGYFTGGTLKIHTGTNKGTYTISSVTATTVVITGSFTGSESSLDFTIEPNGGLGASLQQIYTKIQYQLRQAADIDLTAGSVTGKTASLLTNFVGSRLDAGFYTPTNPNGGGSGVIVEGVTTAESNSIRFYDNTATQREYPYSASGSLNFNSFLTQGGTGYYRMYITDSYTGADDYGTATAITVLNSDGTTPIAGTITGASIPFTFDYTNNSQGGRPTGGSASPLAVTIVAGNKGFAKPVVATGSLTQSKAISITLTAEQDRAYSNP